MPARLDAFIKRLLDEQAEQIRFQTDEPVVLVKGGVAHRLSKNPVTDRQITALIREVAPPELLTQLEEGPATEFGYGRVRVRVQAENGGLVAVVSPDTESAKAVATTARVDSDLGRLPQLLQRLVETNSSDLHLRVGEAPIFRTYGEMAWQEGEPFTASELEATLLAVMPRRVREEWQETGDGDFGHEIPGLARFRVNVARDRKGPLSVFRVIPVDIITVDDLGISPAVRQLCYLTKGLVLVTGPTGSGKSTTLCALIDLINRERTDHVITIEDPIEFVHENKKCLITQREVGTHTVSFKAALRAVLREDPDVVLVGELRDLETTAIAIETAETGHLVFGTLHTTTAASTVDRVIDQFPGDRQSQIRTMLSESLKGVIAQTLCKKIGGGRVAAWEILLTTPAVSNLIREGKTFQIPSIIQTSKKLGMTTLNDSLLDLVDKRAVDPMEAYMKSVEKGGMATALRGRGHKLDLSGLE
ncbi:MAG: type IV pilus twitching motility protein PilT [Rhodothermales bacterium]|nr:type IV pilus twitching motility protein PilT [Rhodothermales bacterium]